MGGIFDSTDRGIYISKDEHLYHRSLASRVQLPQRKHSFEWAEVAEIYFRAGMRQCEGLTLLDSVAAG